MHAALISIFENNDIWRRIMLAEMNDVLEIITVAIGVFLLQNYVFLEPEMEAAKQKLFYLSSIACIVAGFILLGKDAATFIVLLAGGLNIILRRKEHRLRGFFLTIPLLGILNGLAVPFLVVAPYLIGFTEQGILICRLFAYGLLALLLILFFVKGKKWREWFRENMQKRHMRRWEKILLCVVGTLMLSYSGIVERQLILNGQLREAGYEYAAGNQFARDIGIYGMIAFALTIAVIVLIMQGNLREEKERADAANKAKSAFISNISHEIRTPMNAIVGMTQIMLRRELPKQEREYLLNIRNSGNALLAIINDLLDMSKIESGKMELVDEEYDFMSMLSDLGMIILNRIGNKPVELLFDIDPDIPAKLYGDALRIRQIIINLMNNATKFTEEGYVCLTVKVKQMQQEDVELFVSVKDTGQGIREEDIGRLFGSFQQVDAKKNHHKEGTGLGLSISKQFVELMGGSIGVTSEYGRGSEFYFTIHQQVTDGARAAGLSSGRQAVVAGNLKNKAADDLLKEMTERYQLTYEPDIMAVEQTELPVFYFTDQPEMLSEEKKQRLNKLDAAVCGMVNPMAEDAFPEDTFTMNKPLYSHNFCDFIENHETWGQENTETAEEKNAEIVLPDAQVLIVDDNEINRMIAVEMLDSSGMQIDTAVDGLQAVEMVQKKEYDLIFMDHQMPVMDGIEAIKAIRSLEGTYYKEVPVIALTANTAKEQQEEYRQTGMSDYLSKPIDMEELYEKVRKWVKKF